MSDFEDRVRRDLHRSADAVEPPPLLWRRVEDRLGGRDRRPMAVLATAAAVVVAVAILAVVLHDGGSAKHVASVSPETTEPQGIVVPEEQTTSSSALSTTEVGRSATTSSTRATTTTTAGPPPCLADDLAFSTRLDQPTYDSSTPVVFRGVARNVSARSCVFIHDKCSIASVFEDKQGTIWDSRGYDPNLSSCMFPHLEDLLAPDQAVEGPTWTWDHSTCANPRPTTTSSITSSRPCDGPPAKPGRYNATASWSYGDYNAYQRYGYPPWEYNRGTDNGKTIYVYNAKNDSPSAPFEIVG